MMPDLNVPHVSVLGYEVTLPPHQEIVGDPDELIEHELFDAKFVNDGARFRCEMKEHFATVKAAREAVDPVLRWWHVYEGLKDHPFRAIRFKFAGATLVDLEPDTDPPPQVSQPASLRVETRLGSPTSTVMREEYPRPPDDFVATELVDDLWERCVGYHEEQEPLQAFAYFVLSSMQNRFGDRRRVAKALNLDYAVVDRVGKLSSIRGDASTARKAPSDREYRPLSYAERRWLESVVNEMILRLGQHEAGAKRKLLSEDELPSLSDS